MIACSEYTWRGLEEGGLSNFLKYKAVVREYKLARLFWLINNSEPGF